MDLLSSLHEYDLPEQQTRIHCLSTNCDNDGKLGFELCCNCGKALKKKTLAVECEHCHRIKYCSEECRYNDASCTGKNEGGGGADELSLPLDQSQGHTAIVCALLDLCNDDDLIEASVATGKEYSLSLTAERKDAAIDRIASEFESYPATLANVIVDGPCYQNSLQNATGACLTIHIIGSSADSELWQGHPDKNQEEKVFQCYAEALAELAEKYKIETILLQFFGPECPKKNINTCLNIPVMNGCSFKGNDHNKPSKQSKLCVMTFNSEYDGDGTKLQSQSQPDILVFFNPGFTCPDYTSWEKTLMSCMNDNFDNTNIPFLVTTNTEMEALADMQYLFDNKLFQNVPRSFTFLFQNTEGGRDCQDRQHSCDNDCVDGYGDNESNKSSFFFSVNPFCGLRVRQSGTLANDLYVKSRWIFGGLSGKRKERKESLNYEKKRKRVQGKVTNKKKTNPALI